MLEAARAELADGSPLPRDQTRELRRFVHGHRSDPRAHLVLARHFVALAHDRSAIERYALAYEVDPSARHDADMLSDLVRLAGHAPVSEEAGRLLRRVYGASATDAIERRLANPDLPRRDADRLRELRDALAR